MTLPFWGFVVGWGSQQDLLVILCVCHESPSLPLRVLRVHHVLRVLPRFSLHNPWRSGQPPTSQEHVHCKILRVVIIQASANKLVWLVCHRPNKTLSAQTSQAKNLVVNRILVSVWFHAKILVLSWCRPFLSHSHILFLNSWINTDHYQPKIDMPTVGRASLGINQTHL